MKQKIYVEDINVGALKCGMAALVVTKNRYAAERFMNENFNKPDNILKSVREIRYLYNNSDEVIWAYPNESSRGRRCNFLYYDDTVDNEILENIFIPMVRQDVIFKISI